MVYGPPERAQERLIIAECNLMVRDKRFLKERKMNDRLLHKVCLQFHLVRVCLRLSTCLSASDCTYMYASLILRTVFILVCRHAMRRRTRRRAFILACWSCDVCTLPSGQTCTLAYEQICIAGCIQEALQCGCQDSLYLWSREVVFRQLKKNLFESWLFPVSQKFACQCIRKCPINCPAQNGSI